jgi:tetratricopeptide (TPR) repeat protein
MKRLILLPILLLASLLQAQTLDEGNRYLYQERYATAANTFRQLTQKEPLNGEAWLGLAQALTRQQQAATAREALNGAPAEVRSAPSFLVAQGTLALASGQVGEATNYFNEAAKATREKDPAILSAIAQAHLDAESGDAALAREFIQKAIKRNKRDAALYVQLGDAHRKGGNSSEAYQAYREALEVNDRYAPAYHRIGDIFLSQKNAALYLENFNKAVAADGGYAPSLRVLYAYEFSHDPARALELYRQYVAQADGSVQLEYDLADLLYLNKQYNNAITKAEQILQQEGDSAKPRLHKLIAYSRAAKKDTAGAMKSMLAYFDREADSNLLAKDFSLMASLVQAVPGNDSLALTYLERGLAYEKDDAARAAYFKELAAITGEQKNYAAQAKWLGEYYRSSDRATNLDLFNWGLASYRAEDYKGADSVFGLYVEKYPEQSFGYYWQAKSKALQDKEMKAGLAIPAYQKLIEVLQTTPDDANYKRWMVEAYGYLAAYEANTEKDYTEAVGYFEKVLEIDPDNADAKRYISLLDKD